MLRQLCCVFALAGALWGRGEIIDRVAVTVDKMVITESDIVNQMRIAAFLNAESLDLIPAQKREAATRLVEQVLIRREMEISRYPAPALSDTGPILEEIKRERFPDAESYQRELDRCGIRERDLRENLLLQMTMLRFIEYRFRPGIAVSDEEVSQYYEQKLLPEYRQRRAEAPPALEDSREQIEEILIEERVDRTLERWLQQAAGQARIRFREEVFQ